MNCHETHRLLEADVDGELDLVHHLELEEHLRTCPQCTALRETFSARRTALRETLPRFNAPSTLANKVRTALRTEEPVKAEPACATPPATASWSIWNTVGLAASVGLALVLGYTWGGARARGNRLVDDAISDHIRSLQFNHLADVASTDQHTVKPWFAGRLDFSPPVVDLATAGFPLTGGRLDQLAGRPAAALVFHRREHAINLFIWPATAEAVASRQSGLNGYHTQCWSQKGFNFLAVSEISAAELSQFAAAFQAANPG